MEQKEIILRDTVEQSDVEQVRAVVESSGFFSPEEIQIAVELVEDRLAQGQESGYYFLFADCGGIVAGYTCYGNIPATAGSFDLYWIAVRKEWRRKGLGKKLLEATEQAIAKMGGRRVYIETSSRELYAPTRAFYVRNGYKLEATLENFYADGDSKHIYSKKIL